MKRGRVNFFVSVKKVRNKVIMRKTEILLYGVIIAGTVLAGAYCGSCFERNRSRIIDLLAKPSLIEETITQKYSVAKSAWVRTDLADGTPRWMAQVKQIYNYELIGSPLEKVTFLTGVTSEASQVAELMVRSGLLMRAVGMSKEKAGEAFEALVTSASGDKGQKYYFEAEGIRAEMIWYEAMDMLILTLKEA